MILYVTNTYKDEANKQRYLTHYFCSLSPFGVTFCVVTFSAYFPGVKYPKERDVFVHTDITYRETYKRTLFPRYYVMKSFIFCTFRRVLKKKIDK